MKRISIKYIYYLALALVFFVFLIFLLTDYLITLNDLVLSLRIIVFAVASILLALVVTVGITIFNPILADTMVTLRRMMRIENLSNPILIKLSSEAPGTYHHSLNVSALAHKAAKAIGADSLLVRTASYYHDLGKLYKPLIFIENQSKIEIADNDSEESIRKNADDVISHVEKGVAMAKNYNLPDEIIDLIAEHHGTTQALYFYSKAKEIGVKIKKTDFRYNGPTPQSKESAILMLADCVEAIARSTANLTAQAINKIVDDIIEDRLSDKQLANCGLAEKELAAIAASLKETLLSIHHQRLDYKK